MRASEAHVVSERNFSLQQQVIAEMALNSANPTVSSIALQSLAALHQFEPSDVHVPDALFYKLRNTFRDCFKYAPTTGRTDFDILEPYSSIERFSRAMVYFPKKFSVIEDDWGRILSVSYPPRGLETAVLLASGIKYDTRFSWFVREDSKALLQCILDSPSIEVSKVLPWHYERLVDAVENKPIAKIFTAEEIDGLLVSLVQQLNPETNLTLQHDLLIRFLHAYHKVAIAEYLSLLGDIHDIPKAVSDHFFS